MPKKGVRVIISGAPRPVIDIEAMTRIVIALGRELEQREREPVTVSAKAGRP